VLAFKRFVGQFGAPSAFELALGFVLLGLTGLALLH
jgi:hypothetical protein